MHTNSKWRSLAVTAALVASTVGTATISTTTSSPTAAASNTSFVPIAPARVVDTRSTGTKVGSPDGGGAPLEVSVLGQGGLPGSGIAAVALNVTVVEAEGSGFATVYPCGSRPDASSLNFVDGQTIPNAVIAPVSSLGTVCVYVYGLAHLLADVSGYFLAESDFTPISPVRITDTRGSGSTLDDVNAGLGSVAGNTVLRVPVAGRANIPSEVAAVALNVTIVDAQGVGYATVYPCGTPPEASNLNFVAGQTIPNAVMAPVSTEGEVCIFTDQTVDILVDVSGYFVASNDFRTLTPARVVDTRPNGAKIGALGGGGAPLEVSVLGQGGLPGSGIAAVALNVTVVEAEGAGYVTVYPCGTQPEASNLNFVDGQTIPNAVLAPVSANGTICFYAYGVVHLLADVSGWFPGLPGALGGGKSCTHQPLSSGAHVTRVSGVVSAENRHYVLDDTVPDFNADGFVEIDLFEEIQIFDDTGRHVGRISDTIGKADFAAASGDRLIVRDLAPSGGVIRLFDDSGNHLADLTTTATDTTHEPRFANGRIYVPDTGESPDFGFDDELWVFDRNGTYLDRIPRGEGSFFVGPIWVGGWRSHYEGAGHVYTPVFTPDGTQVKIYDRDGTLVRTLSGYYDVRIGRDRIYLSREIASGTGRIDVYTPNGATLIGTTGPMDGYPSVYGKIGNRIYIYLRTNDDREHVLVASENGPLTGTTMIAKDDGLGVPQLWVTPNHVYVETISDRNDWNQGPYVIFDRHGNRQSELDGGPVFWFRPTETKLFVTNSDRRAFAHRSNGAPIREFAGGGVDAILPPPRPGATVPPFAGEALSHVPGGPVGHVPDGLHDALPTPELVYVRAWSMTGWEIRVHLPDGTYLETMSGDAIFQMGGAVLITAYNSTTSSMTNSIWRVRKPWTCPGT